MDRFFREYEETEGLHSLAGIARFVSGEVFQTKTGEVGLMAELDGIDVECNDPVEISAHTAALASAGRVFDERTVVNIVMQKRSGAVTPVPSSQDRLVKQALDCRRAFLNAKKSELYTYDSLLVVTRKPRWSRRSMSSSLARIGQNPGEAFKRAFGLEKMAEALSAEMDETICELYRATNSFIKQTNAQIRARILSKDDAFSRGIRQLWNPDLQKANAIRLVSDDYVDFQGVDSVLEIHPTHLAIDGEFVAKVLTLKQLPAYTFANIFSGLAAVKADLIISTEWSALDPSKALTAIRSIRRHFHNTKSGLFSQIGSERPTERQILFDQSKEGMVAEAGEALKAAEIGGVQFGRFSLAVLILAKSQAEAAAAASDVMKVVGTYDGALNDERYGILNAFLASVPGGTAYNLRRNVVTHQNYADMVPWFRPSRGEPRNKHLQASSLAVLETEERSLFHFNLHVEDVFNTMIIGRTGAGKSFLLSFLIIHYQQYSPRTFIFDYGGSCRWLVELLGGSYVTFRSGDQSFKIGIFCQEPTAANLEWIAAFVKLLIESEEFRMTASQEREMFESIKSLYHLEPTHRRLLTLSQVVPKGIGQHLRRWVEGGQYGSLFDHAEDTLGNSNLQCIEFQDIDRIGGGVAERMLFCLLRRANDVIHDDALKTTPKLVVFDEAFLLLKNESTRNYLEDGLRTWRKHNAGVILSTQFLQDLAISDSLRPLIDNCPTKLLLSNPTLDESFYAEVLQMNSMEIEKVRGLIPKRQFLLKRDGLSKVLNLNVDSKSYWLFTTNPYETERRQKLIDQFGLTTALEILSGGSQ